jgi:intraflagellar transport protein 172
MNEDRKGSETKRVAFLVDLQTIHIMDLSSGTLLAQISHDSKLDWLGTLMVI